MIVLAVTTLFIPLLQPKEVEAVGPLTPLVPVIVGGLIGIGGVVLGVILSENKCSECKREVANAESHWDKCPKGHRYYGCRWYNIKQHEPYHAPSPS